MKSQFQSVQRTEQRPAVEEAFMPVQDEPKGDLQAQHSAMHRGPGRSMYSYSQMVDMSFEERADGNTSLALTESILRPYGVVTAPMSASSRAASVSP